MFSKMVGRKEAVFRTGVAAAQSRRRRHSVWLAIFTLCFIDSCGDSKGSLRARPPVDSLRPALESVAAGSLRICLTTEQPYADLWKGLPTDSQGVHDARFLDRLPAWQRTAVDVASSQELSRPFGAAFLSEWRWQPGIVLRIRFFNGSRALRARTMAIASTWSAPANIRFVETALSSADIRVRFTNSNTSWARIGTTYRAAYSSPDSATMSLGNVTELTPADSFSAVVLHEFGHVLGLIHEHQHPDNALDWNEPRAIDYFARTYGWNEATVRTWVFGRYLNADLVAGPYDSLSIMHYPLPGALTYSGRGAPFNHALSSRDLRFIAFVYPR